MASEISMVTPAASTNGPFVPEINPATNAYGMNGFPTGDPYQSSDSYAVTGSMTFRGQPYGYYDTGTLLSLVATTLPLASSRAGVNGGFEAGVSAMAGYPSIDMVPLYVGSEPTPPPLVLYNVTYDATHVYPASNLTAAQIAALRVNMWVMTNSIDTTVSATPAVPNGLPPETHYASYVTGWAANGSSITVAGWTVPGSGHTTAGQVPSSTLDTGAPNATAYFGSPTGHTGMNIVLQHNPSTQLDDRRRALGGLEIDVQSWATADYTLASDGLAISYTAYNGAALSSDSNAIILSGYPNGININNAALTGLQISAGTALVSDVFNANHWWSPPVWSGTPTTNLLWETQGYIDSNQLQLQCWVSRDTPTPGWQGASLRLGLRIDGTPLTVGTGAPQAQLVWNGQGYPGGLQLQTASGIDGLSMDSSGVVHIPTLASLNVTGAAALNTLTVSGASALNTLTVSGASNMAQLALSGVLYPDNVATASLPAAGAGAVMLANDAINPVTNTATGPQLVHYAWDGQWHLVGRNEIPQTTAYSTIQLAPNVAASAAGGMGLFGAAPVASKPNVAGAWAGNTAGKALSAALAAYGLITDSTTA
jgi:hypothetical protein